jgi:hypothetical protein
MKPCSYFQPQKYLSSEILLAGLLCRATFALHAWPDRRKRARTALNQIEQSKKAPAEIRSLPPREFEPWASGVTRRGAPPGLPALAIARRTSQVSPGRRPRKYLERKFK